MNRLMIAIHCGGMPFDGDTIPRGGSLGGSESAAYFMAKELAGLGHKVVVFSQMVPGKHKPGHYGDVIYENLGDVSEQTPMGRNFHTAMQAPWDVLVMQRHPAAFQKRYNSKLSIWWLHDLALHRYAPLASNHLPFVDSIFTVSEFHKAQVEKVFGFTKNNEKVFPTFNGVDYEMVAPLRENPPVREQNALVFASRPERGLEELVGYGGIMEMLPECHLHVCGYDNTVPEMRAMYEFLWGRCAELKNVTHHGHLGKQDLYRLLAKSALYVYPTTFIDTSNIMLLEANAVGTPFVGPADHAALPETGKNAGVLWVPLKKGEINRQAFAREISAVVASQKDWRRLHLKALAKEQSWKQAALQWEEKFYTLLAERSDSKTRLVKHLERMSDIKAITTLMDVEEVEKILPAFRNDYRFFVGGESLSDHYDGYYRYEKERGVEYGPESLDGNPRFEHTLGMVKQCAPKAILDYGCAHGHYTMNLWSRLKSPACKLLGVDINQSNIDTAIKWRDSAKVAPETLDFVCSDIDALLKVYEGVEKKPFDLALCCEVLEHIPEPEEFSAALLKLVQPGGWVIFTTPYGPWEAMGYKKHPGWRAHLHHFEREDIYEVFGEQPGFQLLTVPVDVHLGHNIWRFKVEEGAPPLGVIDYARKLNTQAPRETVSVCMIARDEEDSIGKALRSVLPIADEIIVAIDENSKDSTREIAEKFGAKIITIPSPMDIGFDAARNLSIEPAKMDWIFWMDCDETLENAENLRRYLRPNVFNGYGVAQHHYSIEPPSLIRTDFPCRLFRNHIGMKFYGVVHEHPEMELNKGPGTVHLIQNVGIMHNGYSTEKIRRERFQRNFPLMERDHQKYPERFLGQFLWLRDCAHMAKYILEHTGGRPTEDVAKYCQEGIKIFRDIVKEGNVRLIIDAVQFYSECVAHLHNGSGIFYKLNLGSKKAGAVRFLPEDKTVEGYFENTEDIRDFSKVMVEKNLELLEDKYF
jgi:2-polyprenyl-3-methyl-5-hydroxy-6-metoxy-1,4-benzoquinol methylase/glycosyltransferase involved in cell wall biosynthesis